MRNTGFLDETHHPTSGHPHDDRQGNSVRYRMRAQAKQQGAETIGIASKTSQSNYATNYAALLLTVSGFKWPCLDDDVDLADL